MNLPPGQSGPTNPTGGEQQAAHAFFGSLLTTMQRSLVTCGSELGLGLILFSLTASIQAVNVIEIGRYMGFSTFCLASALKFLDLGWAEPPQHMQRPDVNYNQLALPKQRKLVSVDPVLTPEAVAIIREAGLEKYVKFVAARSDQVNIQGGVADLLFIDGDHTYIGCKSDVVRYVPWLRPGGYFILHDYFGWYDLQGRNNSPIKQVCDEIVATGIFEHILIDTHYMSFMIFRKKS